MKNLKKFIVCIMTLVMCMGILTLPVFASTTSQDGLEISLTTDNDSYDKDENIVVTLSVKNTNSESVTNVTLEQMIPDGYVLMDGNESVMELDTLEAGETITLTLTLVPDSVGGGTSVSVDSDSSAASSNTNDTGEAKTGDNSQVELAIALFVIASAGIVVLVVIKKKHGKQLLSILLCASMMGGLISQSSSTVEALEGDYSATINTTVSVDDNDLVLTAVVTYSLNDSSIEGTYYTVTFDTNGGSSVDSQKVAEGEKASVPVDPEKDGYAFIGWYVSNGYSQPFDFDQEITGDVTVYAKWYDENDMTDTDGDGLTDSLEEAFETDPNKKDTDNDGLSDYYELNWINTNPLVEDTDGNGVLDSDEDADGDGLTNAEEESLDLNPIYKDSDYDSITDYDEINIYGTDPNNDDSDGDGVIDGIEVMIGSDPLKAEDSFVTEASYGEISDETPVVVSVEAVTDAQGAGTLTIDNIDVTDNVLISKSIPGYLGCAYDFSIEGNLSYATITFEYDSSLGTVGDSFNPCIYYFNEEEGTFEELDSTINSDGTISAQVTHFSTYILLNKVAFDEVWENEIKSPDDSYSEMNCLDVVLVIDSSGSMSSNDSKKLRLTAAKSFVDKLGEDDRGAVIDFDSSATLYQGLTSDHDALYTAIEKINSSGGTNISNAMKLAISQFTSDDYTREDAYKYIILLTDGDGTYSTSYTTLAAENNIVVYTIGLGSGVKESVLSAIAEGTGGKYYFASEAIDLSDIYEEISFETIDYTTDSNNDGISDYYTNLINSGDLRLSTGSSELAGVTDMFGEDSDDWDGDGLKNGEEISVVTNNGKTYLRMKSDPLYVDTDMDGYTDYEEIKEMSTSPTKYTQYDGSAYDTLLENSYYTYIEYSEDGSIAASVKNFFDWQKTDESKELLINFFYDYASEETISENADAIAKLELKEKVVSILDEIVSIVTTTNTIIGDLSEVGTDSSEISDELKKINDNRKVLIEAYNDDNTDAIKDANDKLGLAVKGTNLVSKLPASIEGFSDVEEKVAAVTSALSAASKCFDVQIISVGDSLTKFATNYKIFMGTKTSLGITNGTVISIVSDVSESAIDIAETCNTYGKLQANTEAFEANIDMLVYVYQYADEDYIRSAAGDVAEIVLDSSWDSYYSQLNASVGKEIALLTFNVALDIASDVNPYVKIANTIYKAIKATLSVTGISETSKYMLKTEVMRSVSNSCVDYLSLYVSDDGSWISYYSSRYDAVQRYLVQLAQCRIVGEDFMETALTQGNIINWTSHLITWTSKKEIKENYENWISSIYANARTLNLTLSTNLPQYPS